MRREPSPAAAAGPAASARREPQAWKQAWTLPALIGGSAAIAVGLDPYLSIASPLLAQAINATGPILLALLLFSVTGRLLLTLSLVAVVQGVLVFANATKQAILYNNLLYADFKILPELVKQPELVAGFVRISSQQVILLAVCSATLLVLAVWSFSRPARAALVRLASAVLLLAGVAAVELYPAPIQIASLGWLLPMQISGASQVGVAGNVLLGRMVASDVLPEVDPAQVARFWADPAVVAAKARLASQPPGPRPDIIFIQSESLFEPSLLCGFPDKPFLDNVAAQGTGSMQNLQVPVFGSRTLQTEFEVLSGFPVDFAPKSLFSYYELVDRPVNALPRHLGKQGYRTVVIHPSVRSFWRRDFAMPAMGFDSFVDGSGYFRDTDFIPAGWVSDAALVGTIVSELEAAQGPSFVFAISIANHGPWGTKAVGDEAGIVLPAALKGPARNELLDYLKRARAADRTYGALLRDLAARTRPTMVVFYGDHLPALTQTYEQLCFKDGRSPREHLPPMRVWSNFPLQASVPGVIRSHLLSGWALRAAGLPMDNQFMAAAVMADLQDAASLDAGRKHALLAMYGHVAAEATLVNRSEPDATPHRAYISRGEAAARFASFRVPGDPGAGTGVADGQTEIELPLVAGEVRDTSFDLGGRLAGAVLRPYLSLTGDACLVNAKAGTVGFEAWADGRRLFAQRLHPNSVKLPFVDLKGVRRLTLRTLAPAGAADCGKLAMRVSQLLCYSADCRNLPEQPMAASFAADVPALPTSPMKDPLASDLGRSYFMLRHQTGFQAPYAPIRLTPGKGIFLHPTAEKTAWLEVDASQLQSVDFVPRIEPLDKACTANQLGGIVGLTISLDGRVLAKRSVDRSSAGTIPVSLDGGRRLRIEVDSGNGVAWCDWFSIGFSRLIRVASPAPATEKLTGIRASIPSLQGVH